MSPKVEDGESALLGIKHTCFLNPLINYHPYGAFTARCAWYHTAHHVEGSAGERTGWVAGVELLALNWKGDSWHAHITIGAALVKRWVAVITRTQLNTGTICARAKQRAL